MSSRLLLYRNAPHGRACMGPLVIALIGAGSRSFGPDTVRDILLSDALAERRLELRLMDIVADSLAEIGRYAKSLAERLGRNVEVGTTAALAEALAGAQFVVTAVEVERNLYWAQDYHIPRKYGFRHVFGENGGPGSLFHALRTMKGMVHIARTMERICPSALLLNYSNPMHKVCDAIATLSKTPCVGLCHGVWMGMEQISYILDKPSAKATGWRTGMRSAWRASCCAGSVSIPRRRAVTWANTSAGRTSSAPTSWTGSTTRRMGVPGNGGKCRSTCRSRTLMGPSARSRSRSANTGGSKSRNSPPPASSPFPSWSRSPAASNAASTPSTFPIAASSPTCPTAWWWRSRGRATPRACIPSGCSRCRKQSPR